MAGKHDAQPDLRPGRCSVRFEDGAEIARGRSHGLCEARVADDCTGRGEQTHHRQPRGAGGVHRAGLVVNRPSALVRLCLPCHGWVETNRDAARARGLLVPRPTSPAAVPVRLSPVYGPGWWLLDDDGNYICPPQDDPAAA